MTHAEKLEWEHQQDLKRLQAFRLLDDDFFTKCFEGAPACVQLVLRIVLENRELAVVDVRTQVFMENLLNRSVRLDVLATDRSGAKYNIEIQRADEGAIRRRARYNSSMMDANLLKKGKHFDDLPETYVIFVTEHDVIGEGEAVYRIERCFLKSGRQFGDGSHILYVNGAYRGEDPVGKLMYDFSCTDPSRMHYDVLADRVRFFKQSKEGITVMCKAMEEMRRQAWNEGRIEGRNEGRIEGRNEGRIEGRNEGRIEGRIESRNETAVRMLIAGRYTLQEIADISGLSSDEVDRLRKEHTT